MRSVLTLVACAAISMVGVPAAVADTAAPPVAQTAEIPAPPKPSDPTPEATVLDTTPVQHPQSLTGTPTEGTLVLYDTTSAWGHLGEFYAQLAGNLSSRFGTWDAKPVVDYRAGDMAAYEAVIYLGSTYDEPLPIEFLDDVLAGRSQVIWAGANLWQLHARAAVDDISGYFVHQYGWQYTGYDFSPVAQVNYRGQSLERDSSNASGILGVQVDDPGKAQVLGEAVRADGSTLPWAVRSGDLTYIGEIPLSYISETDRYLAFADLLFDDLDPAATTRHRGMVRIEDVSPSSDPAQLRAIADVLSSRGIPFSVAVIPVYVNPDGGGAGVPTRTNLADKPEVVAALKYMTAHGGTLLQHGYTHQYGDVANPYNGASGDDFEFFLAHVDQTDRVVLDGPVPEDSADWAGSRMQDAGSAMLAAGLAAPQIWEFPHYAASHADYAEAGRRYVARYERSLYYAGHLSGQPIDASKYVGQFFPYEVVDAYGTRVIPENIGNVSREAYNQHAPVLPQDLIERAQANLAVRDGFASLFFHPHLDPALLAQAVDGIAALGYTFVSPAQVLNTFPRQPVAAPAAPSGLTVSATATSATVSFTAPDTTGTAAVAAYEYSLDNGSTWTRVPATGSSVRLTGLTANTRYPFSLRAINAGGTGPAATAAFTTVRATVPGAPTAVKLTPGLRTLAVSFTAPVSDGGSPLRGYQYSLNGGAWTSTGTGTDTRFEVLNLSANTKYTVRVRAVNAVGNSPASTAVSAIVGPYLPAAPTALTAVAGNGRATISFTPGSDGGDPISNYQYSTNNGSTWVTPDPAITASPVVVTGLTNGVSYKVRVRAINGVGTGPSSVAVTVRPRA